MAKLGGYMVPELHREREESALNLAELTKFIDGGEMITEKRKRVSKSLFHIHFCGANTIFISSDFFFPFMLFSAASS